MGTAVHQEANMALVGQLAPFFEPGVRVLADAAVAAPLASYTFAAIPGRYRGLKLDLLFRSTLAAPAESDAVRLRFNGDTGARYHWGYFERAGAAFASGELLSQAQMGVGACEAAGSTAGFFAPTIIEIVGYNRSVAAHYALGRSTWIGDASAAADYGLGERGGVWVPVAATPVTSVTLFCSLGSIAAGSRLTLRGLL